MQVYFFSHPHSQRNVSTCFALFFKPKFANYKLHTSLLCLLTYNNIFRIPDLYDIELYTYLDKRDIFDVIKVSFARN